MRRNFALYGNKLGNAEEIQVRGLNLFSKYTAQRICVGLNLQTVGICDLCKGIFGYTVCFKIQNGDSVIFNDGAIHNALQ